MRRMAEKLAGATVHDRSLIPRVPGSYNWIYGEPCPVVIEHIEPSFRYGLEELEEMAEAWPAKASDGRNEGGAIPRNVLSDLAREGRRNAALVSVLGSQFDQGLDAEPICVVLLKANCLRCEWPSPRTRSVTYKPRSTMSSRPWPTFCALACPRPRRGPSMMSMARP
jgi:hypothetical protein